MKKYFWSVIIILVLIGGSVMFNKNQTPQGNIKIGSVYPLTGGAASWGVPAKEGIQLAVSEINNNGGINGRKIEVIYEDSKMDPKEGVTAVQKLINVDGVKYILGDIVSGVVLATAPLIEQNKVLNLVQGSSPDISEAGDYIFRNWASDSYQAEKMARYAYAEAGYRKMAVINVNSAYGNGLGDSFKKEFEKLGGEISIKENYAPETKDFKTILLKVTSKGVNAIYLAPNPAETVVIIKQIKEIGLNLPILAGDVIPEFVKGSSGELFEGIIYSTPLFTTEDSIVKEFETKYELFFNKKSAMTLVSAHTYDAVNILAKAMRETKSSDVERVKNYIYQIKNYPGVSGVTTFDQNGDVSKPFGIYKVEIRETVLIGE